MRNIVALNTYLKIFEPYFAMQNVTEICINQLQEVWVEVNGAFKRFEEPLLTHDFLSKFAQLVAESNQREISPEYPTLSAVLPNGLRVQFVIEPAVDAGSFVCAIRQKGIRQTTLHDYFTEKKGAALSRPNTADAMLKAYEESDYERFLKLAILHKKNILISGGTSTGKTTFLNALVQLIPMEERLITIETDREVSCPHLNKVHLLAAEEGKSVANITMLGLLKASLRLRPDRILVSELRAEEAFPYLRAINSGHPGSITTMHADSPMSAFEQLAFMVMQGGATLSRQDIVAYAKSIIHVIVQIKRNATGKRFISEIYFNEAAETQSLMSSVA